jgi:hypothetical protein
MSRRLVRICCTFTSCPRRGVDHEGSNAETVVTSATCPGRRGKAFPDLDLDYRKPDSESSLKYVSSKSSLVGMLD